MSNLQTVEKIKDLLEQADSLWNKLPRDEQNRLNEIHHEENSLGHCLRWGVVATDELIATLEQESQAAPKAKRPSL